MKSHARPYIRFAARRGAWRVGKHCSAMHARMAGLPTRTSAGARLYRPGQCMLLAASRRAKGKGAPCSSMPQPTCFRSTPPRPPHSRRRPAPAGPVAARRRAATPWRRPRGRKPPVNQAARSSFGRSSTVKSKVKIRFRFESRATPRRPAHKGPIAAPSRFVGLGTGRVAVALVGEAARPGPVPCRRRSLSGTRLKGTSSQAKKCKGFKIFLRKIKIYIN